MEKMPKRPENNDPLDLRLRGGSKTPSKWAKLAQEAEKEERWGDAYYFWLAGSTAYTRSRLKGSILKKNAENALEKWEKSIESD